MYICTTLDVILCVCVCVCVCGQQQYKDVWSSHTLSRDVIKHSGVCVCVCAGRALLSDAAKVSWWRGGHVAQDENVYSVSLSLSYTHEHTHTHTHCVMCCCLPLFCLMCMLFRQLCVYVFIQVCVCVCVCDRVSYSGPPGPRACTWRLVIVCFYFLQKINCGIFSFSFSAENKCCRKYTRKFYFLEKFCRKHIL